MGEVRPEFCTPGRVNQGVKAIPLYPAQLKHKGNGQRCDEDSHDAIMSRVLERTKLLNIKFNPDKLQYRVSEVKYAGQIISKSGSQMFLADTLSQAFPVSETIRDDPEMLNIVHTISKRLPMSEKRHVQFKKETELDPELQIVVKYIKEGWPKSYKNVDNSVIWPLIDKRNKLQKEILKHGNSSARPELNKINAEIKRTYAPIKREKWYELCSKLDARSSDTKLWRLARSFCQERPLSKATNTIVNTSYSAPLQDGIVLSPGPDGIFVLMIVGLSNTAKLLLLNLFNQSWALGKLPLEWKRAIVIPILQPGKEADNPENFIPISLTCIPCKIMERIILDRLNFYLAENNLFSRVQYGFRKGHSTTDQIV
ncbi:putative RNA-directed DNA polymerase from transposon BS [Trichonephila clavipes]|nr:putative RNA-directed DNA polymerase from transposon BS [Trichonephila clavipes]